jgi:hypothetical protein
MLESGHLGAREEDTPDQKLLILSEAEKALISFESKDAIEGVAQFGELRIRKP